MKLSDEEIHKIQDEMLRILIRYEAIRMAIIIKLEINDDD